jgi:hypothetical protein
MPEPFALTRGVAGHADAEERRVGIDSELPGLLATGDL